MILLKSCRIWSFLRVKKSAVFLAFAGSVLITLAGASSALADAAADAMIENSKQCLKHFAREERQNGIPKHLLFAVSSTESGRWHRAAGVALPWPWTVNAAGKGYYFDSKTDAIAAVAKFRSQGIQSIDVGCMQINLHHHPEAFSSLQQAFDPERNIAYGAKFLRNNYVELQSWKRAVAAYHSRTESLGDGYFGLVKKNWKRALELVGGSSTYAQSAYMRAAEKSSAPTALPAAKDYNANDFGTGATTSSRQKRTMDGYKSPSMKVISVSDATSSRDTGVLVIRPTQESAQSAPVNLALAGGNNIHDNSTQFVMGNHSNYPSQAHNSDDVRANQPKPISLNMGKPAPLKNGPKFIFQ
jgi:hypothetical protein